MCLGEAVALLRPTFGNTRYVIRNKKMLRYILQCFSNVIFGIHSLNLVSCFFQVLSIHHTVVWAKTHFIMEFFHIAFFTSYNSTFALCANKRCALNKHFCLAHKRKSAKRKAKFATALSQNTRSASFTTQKYINFSNKKIFLKKNLEI